MIISSLKAIIWWTSLLLIMPHNPYIPPVGGMRDTSEESDGIQKPGPTLKVWRLNTNFDNLNNWGGLRGRENCSGNIYSFPMWYDEEPVVILPKSFLGKQIILPVNGHFVFQDGVSTLSGPSSTSTSDGETTCRPREVAFRRSQADWFHPHNWLRRNEGSDLELGGSSSLLNVDALSELGAVAHVERVPCHYDSVAFPANSSFNLKISSNVTITKFFLGNKRISYTNVAILMNSQLGKLQFQKAPETIFSITADENKRGSEGSCEEHGDNRDSDHCICSNYDMGMKHKICALVSCSQNTEEECPNPIIPHGFCCPFCGFHLRIRHSGSLQLEPLYTKLKTELKQRKLAGKVSAHLTRYQKRGAHLVVVPRVEASEEILYQIAQFVFTFQSILNKESGVIGVTLTESWERLLPSEAGDRLEGSGVGGGLITLIVLLLLVAILAGAALFIFIWSKKHGRYPTMTLSSVTSVLQRVPSMSIPIVPGRRSSALSSSLHSFGFARFTNERGSTVTISPGAEGSAGPATSKLAKSSSIRRAEQVDEDTHPVTVEEKVTDADSGAFGFTNVSYDLIGVDQEQEKKEELVVSEGDNDPPPTAEALDKGRQLALQIPEVTVVDIDDGGERNQRKTTPEDSTSGGREGLVKEQRQETASANKDGQGKGISSKFGKPSFVTSIMGKAYQKLEPEDEVEEKGSKQTGSNKKMEGGTSETKSDADSKDQQDHPRQQERQVGTQEQDVEATENTETNLVPPPVPPREARDPFEE